MITTAQIIVYHDLMEKVVLNNNDQIIFTNLMSMSIEPNVLDGRLLSFAFFCLG